MPNKKEIDRDNANRIKEILLNQIKMETYLLEIIKDINSIKGKSKTPGFCSLSAWPICTIDIFFLSKYGFISKITSGHIP